MNKLLFDFQLAYAMHGYYLKIYRTDVDDNGYDLIIDSEDVSRKVQVKSTMVDSSTKSWEVASGVLLPECNQMRQHSMWSNLGAGVGGGVVLQEVTLKTSGIDVAYYFTDLVMLSLFAFEIIGSKTNNKSALRVISELHDKSFHDKVRISKSCFLKIISPEKLVELMGFTSNRMYGDLIYNLKCINNPKYSNTPRDIHIKNIIEHIDLVKHS